MRVQNSFLYLSFLLIVWQSVGQTAAKDAVYKPFVNQAGYNLGESKRFVCYGAPDNTPFKIVNTKTAQTVFEGKMENNEGWFSELNPVTAGDEFVVEVDNPDKTDPLVTGGSIVFPGFFCTCFV